MKSIKIFSQRERKSERAMFSSIVSIVDYQVVEILRIQCSQMFGTSVHNARFVWTSNWQWILGNRSARLWREEFCCVAFQDFRSDEFNELSSTKHDEYGMLNRFQVFIEWSRTNGNRPRRNPLSIRNESPRNTQSIDGTVFEWTTIIFIRSFFVVKIISPKSFLSLLFAFPKDLMKHSTGSLSLLYGMIIVFALRQVLVRESFPSPSSIFIETRTAFDNNHFWILFNVRMWWSSSSFHTLFSFIYFVMIISANFFSSLDRMMHIGIEVCANSTFASSFDIALNEVFLSKREKMRTSSSIRCRI